MNKEERTRVKTYYDREQYSKSNLGKNMPGLFEGTVEIFNPIRDIVKALSNTALKGLNIDNDKLKEIWEINQMTTFSKKIAKDMYLNEEVFVEVILTPDEQIRYLLHSVDDIEYVEVFGEIKRFKVEGEQIYYDENGEEQSREYSREYIKLDNGSVKRTEKIDGDTVETPFILDKIPVSKFKNDSNIIEALNIIDKINETECYIGKIFGIHGDPMLHASNIKQFADVNSSNSKIKKNAQLLEEARYKQKRIINTQNTNEMEASFKYIELTNPLISEMQNDIARLEKRLSNLFPEYLLVDTATQNVSEETYLLKNNGLKTKVASFREDFIKSLLELDKIALELSGSSDELTEADYTYFDTFLENEKSAKLATLSLALDVISKAKEIDDEYKLKNLIEKITDDTLQDLGGLYD